MGKRVLGFEGFRGFRALGVLGFLDLGVPGWVLDLFCLGVVGFSGFGVSGLRFWGCRCLGLLGFRGLWGLRVLGF